MPFGDRLAVKADAYRDSCRGARGSQRSSFADLQMVVSEELPFMHLRSQALLLRLACSADFGCRVCTFSSSAVPRFVAH